MSLSQAAIEHQKKIHLAKTKFETDGGKAIDPAHVTEWALLEIAEMLQASHYQVTLMAIPNRGTKPAPAGFDPRIDSR